MMIVHFTKKALDAVKLTLVLEFSASKLRIRISDGLDIEKGI